MTTGTYTAARLHRRLMRHARLVGITGSCGKSTTADLVAAVLGGIGPAVNGIVVNTRNSVRRPPYTVLSLRPRHRYCVTELSGNAPGSLERVARFLPPDIAIVTHIADDHYKSFRGLEATAAEKGRLIEALPFDGLAILNRDDPLVWAMREKTRARVISCGRTPEADVEMTALQAVWPDRLRMRVRYGVDEVDVQTQFIGDYAVLPVLAALAVGVHEGLTLQAAARAIETVGPVAGRLSAHQTPDGLTFIDDTWKAPLYSLPVVFDVMQKARARRKIIVLGSISDYTAKSSQLYRKVARQALDIAEHVVIVGRWSGSVSRLRTEVGSDRLFTAETMAEVNEHLRATLRPDDLVLLKGSFRADHLERLMLDRTESVDCWRNDCGRGYRCQVCDRLHTASSS
jgi:UDP-N-acetylmuramyl pentapeptide synthase